MQNLSPEYLGELARQIAFVSVFLGGCAAAIMIQVLTSRSDARVAGLVSGAAALAASALALTALSAIMLTVTVHPQAPSNLATPAVLLRARVVTTLSFLVGVYAFLFAVGASGWIRSRRMGVFTVIVASVAALLISWAVSGF